MIVITVSHDIVSGPSNGILFLTDDNSEFVLYHAAFELSQTDPMDESVQKDTCEHDCL